ncbi:MAG: TrkH family potassium uptake protein [Phycisphaerae bacterium]
MQNSAPFIQRFIYRPQNLLVMTFGGLIVVGTVLLSLPVSQQIAEDGTPIGILDSFFTATSAVCVTGLITHDTATAYSRFGQSVILVLIQLGGLGIMTFAAIAASVLGRRMSFGSHEALGVVFFQGDNTGDLVRSLRRILGLTLCLEAVGAALIYWGMRMIDFESSIFDAVFLAISAFCNAGFSTYSDSVIKLSSSWLAFWTLLFLIFFGGIGYTVLMEMLLRFTTRRNVHRNVSVRWSLNSRVALWMSGLLIVAGAVAIAILGVQPSSPLSLFDRCRHALFQSITARTAGFNSVSIQGLPTASLLILIPLMFVGGSPGSCAGGVKTTSIAVWFAQLRNRLRGIEDVVIFERRLPLDIVRRARLLISIAILWNAIGVFVLVLSEGFKGEFAFEDLIFEQVSAFATVGLSTGITGELSVVGKLWIVASMFVGRLGPLTVALVVLQRPRQHVSYPHERVMIG